MSVPHLDFTEGTGHPWFLAKTFASLIQEAARMSRRNAPVLILGGRGSRHEREALARIVHERSPRARGPFAKMSWEVLSESYVESQLFGTGRRHPAEAVPGLVENTTGGTLYIEEIVPFSFATQAKLTALLQTGRYRPADAPYEKEADIRLIVGTGNAQGDTVPDDTMYPDLRSEVWPNALVIPPLCERADEIEPIARQLIQEYADQTGRRPPELTAAARDALSTYAWPNNTEELARAIKHAVDSAPENSIDVGHLPAEVAGEEEPTPLPAAGLRQTLDRVERDMIVRALQASRGNQTRAAKALGISERLMGLRVRKYQLDPRSYRTKT